MKSAAYIIMIYLCSIDDGYRVHDEFTITCGDDPYTSIVNVTYFGEADKVYPVINNTILGNCNAKQTQYMGYVFHDVNHNDCGFMQLNNTNTWGIKFHLQTRRRLVTILNTDYYLTCVYDNYQQAENSK